MWIMPQEVCSFRPLPCAFAWERVPDRAGEGWQMKMLVFEYAERRGPHPAFSHLLPPAAGEGESCGNSGNKSGDGLGEVLE